MITKIEDPNAPKSADEQFVERWMKEQARKVMVCKLQLHALNVGGNGYDKDNNPLPAARVRMGAVWEGSADNQAKSENAVFGHWTPNAEFTATIMNQQVIDRLKEGKKYYLTFTEAPD